MNWRLGLDMGTNSIGWTVLKISKSAGPELLDMGTRIFTDGRVAETGVPLNEDRRNARQMRRQRDRKRRRKSAMLHFLIANKLMPQDKEKRYQAAQLDPYEIRNAALERKLKPLELGRIMIQFAIRRGFKSGRKDRGENSAEQEGMLGGIGALQAELHGSTLGQWLYQQRNKGNSVRFKARIERSKVLYSFYPSREMYEAEFEAIRKKQEKYFKELNWDRLHWLIFFQRPLKRPERGKCQFYHDEERGYKAFVSAQRFRILQDLGNLKYNNDENCLEEIPVELKAKLFKALDTQKTLSFDKIRKLLGERYTGTFNLEDKRRSGLKGNETSVDFRKSECFGSLWDTLTIQQQDEIVETLMLEEDENKIKEFLTPFGLTADQIKRITGCNISTGTAMLSSRFMIECGDIMLKEHLRYDEAVKKLGLHHSDKGKQALHHLLPYYGKILVSAVTGGNGEEAEESPEKKYGHIPNPTVHIALNQLRKVVNALIRRYGTPNEIILEISRELKQSRAKREEITRDQTKNQKENERIRGELENLGFIQASNEDIKKYKLWEELARDGSGMNRSCPYCGKTISAAQLVSGSIEIEHILPYSRTLLNSWDNLTVAHKTCNQVKGDRSPFEAFGNSPAGFDWGRITEMALKLPWSKRNKFSPNVMDRFREKEGGFLEKQLTDTAYLSRASKDYLAAICDKNKIWVSTGRLTAILRGLWGFNTLLNRTHDTWFKNRNDHRHHALDSLVIGLCDRGLIAKAAAINSRRGYRNIDAPPCPIPRNKIEEYLKKILVSYKPDHGREGKLYAETALAKHSYVEKIDPKDLDEKEIGRVIPKSVQSDIADMVRKQGFRKAKGEIQKKYDYLRVFRDKYVSRKPIVSLTDNDISNICDMSIRTMLQEFVEKNRGRKLPDVLSEFSQRTGIFSVRYFPKDQTPLKIKSVPNKYYMPEDFYRVDIWGIPVQPGEFKYEGVFISRPKAAEKVLYGDAEDQMKKPHPAAKLVMSLCKNDIIELSNDNIRELCRVAGLNKSSQRLDIQPIYASDTIASWYKDTNTGLTSSFWPHNAGKQYFKSINVLFKHYQVKLVKITIDGKPFCRS